MTDTADVLQPVELDPATPVRTVRGRARRIVLGVLSIALAVTLIGYVLPRVVGTTSDNVRTAFQALSGREAVVLFVLWAAGLLVHSFVLTGALPGLTTRRALMLNQTGSSVANVLPFGGAAGMSLNYVMVRSWGIDSAAFASYTFVTNVWVILLKLSMPAIALAALVATGDVISPTLSWVAVGSVVALTCFVGALIAGLANRRVAMRFAAILGRLVSLVRRAVRRTTDHDELVAGVLETRDQVVAVVGRTWVQLSVAMLGYGALQALLLWACVHAVGGHLGVVQVLAGFAVDRVASLIVLTPGAAGFAEAGTAAVLVALGGAPATIAAGVLLYRAFTFALEIPVGGTWLAGWLVARRLARRRAVALVGADA